MGNPSEGGDIYKHEDSNTYGADTGNMMDMMEDVCERYMVGEAVTPILAVHCS